MVTELFRVAMRSRFSCPNCKGNLKERVPNRYPRKWYKFVSCHTLQCPYCDIEIVRRFENFDIALVMLATSNLFVSIFTVLKVGWMVLLVLLIARFLIGMVMPKYILVVRQVGQNEMKPNNTKE